MLSTEKMPTFDEFKQAVEEDFLRMDDSEDAVKHFKSHGAQSKIQRDYAFCVREFNAGTYNRNVFMKGGVAATSNCLKLMMR